MLSSALPLPPTAGTAPSAVRTWTLCSAEGAVDVDVRAPDDAVLADVLDALADDLELPGAQLWSESARISVDTPLSAPALRHGAVLGLGRPGPRRASEGGSGALELHLAGGPDAGRILALEQGSLVVGRGSGCGLQIADPDVSRQHAIVSVAEGRVTVADLASSNGTWLTGGSGPPRPVGVEPCEWPVGTAVRLGASLLQLTGPGGAAVDERPWPGGRVLLRPVPGTHRAVRPVVVELPAPPAQETRRRLGWVAVALPAVGGLLMAWLLSAPQFLFFALLSPLVAVAGWFSDRVSGRRAHRRALAAHAVERALAEAELAAAVCADLIDRNEQHPDLARLAAAARRRSSALWSRTADPAGLTLRIGCGAGTTAVTRLESGGSRSLVPAPQMPVTVSLAGCGSLGIVGPRGPALGVARALLCQLAVLAAPEAVDVVICCAGERAAEWSWARWLPHLREVVLPGQPFLGDLGDPHSGRTTVVLLDGPVDAAVAEALARDPDRLVRLDVADSVAGLALPAAVRVEVTGETGATGLLHLPGTDGERIVTLDAASWTTAAAIARDLAPLAAPISRARLPDSARLLDLGSPGPLGGDAVEASGNWTRDRRRLLAVLGVDARGPQLVDLVADGPHALIAGTTGSGKSELLQTLVASLALHHPPDRCSFLLVDYKGGAAFGAAADLPHTVGVLTDLDHQSTARALRSLTAELTRRERLLAGHGARDLGELPDGVAVSRLVIVVDEFATLAEELPGFVHGLVGIAQRGRSLGVHLVLATQRPGGVVSPEIRANCSLRICLRTTDEGDARDVLGSTGPAHLPPDRPGRAYLRTGSAPPVLFQVARVSGTPAGSGPLVTARRRRWPAAPAAFPAAAEPTGARSDLLCIVGALRARAAADGVGAPDRPWLPPLPDALSAEALDAWTAGAPPPLLALGLVDTPDAQAQSPLTLDLTAGGGHLLVGGPRSGRTTALRTVLTEAVHRLSPARLHVHVLDHGGGALAAEAAALPHCSTAVDRGDPHRTMRRIARLGQEVDRRRGRGEPGDDPLLLVLVDGYESLAAQLEEADPATGSAGLLRLVRDGAAAGVTVVLTAERAVPGSRVAAAVRTRLVLPLPDRADYAVAGLSPRSVPGHRPPGRALVGEDGVECQLALPRSPAEPMPAPDARTPPPLRIAVLAADPELPLPGGAATGGADGLWLAIGPGGDDGTALGVDLRRTGGLLVVGPPGSGRSDALSAFARHCAGAGAAVVELVDGPPERSAGGPEPDRLGRADPAGLRSWLAGQDAHTHPVVVVDDLPSLPETVSDMLVGGPLVLASGTAADLAGSFRGPAVALRRSRTVLLLQPSAGDAELLGLRTPRTPAPGRPGAGWLLSPNQATRVQAARRRTR